MNTLKWLVGVVVFAFLGIAGCGTVDEKLLDAGQAIQERVCPQDLVYRLTVRKKAWDVMQLDTSQVCATMTEAEKAAYWNEIAKRP